MHLWLHVDGLGPVRVHTAGDGSLDLRVLAPYDGYSMDTGGRVIVESGATDSDLAPFVGEVVQSVRELRHTTHDEAVGIVLDFGRGSVGIANVADDLVLLPWPSPGWAERSIELTHA